MKRLAFNAFLKLASALVILNQDTGGRTPWVLNDEQREVLQELCEHQRVLILKGRQVGVSTACLLFDLAFAIANPGVAVCIVADEQLKAEGLLAKVAAWARSIAIKLTKENVRSIELPNGSTIDARSAISRADDDESRVGRSKTYALLHLSEVGFWANDRAVFAALTSSALPSARIVIESTASASENLLKQLWDEADNGWHHVFLSMERHAIYTAGPASITEARWAELQLEHGFTSRPHAAWWHHKIKTDLGGDVHRGLREFPVQPDDCFVFAEGRWILTHTPAKTKQVGPWAHYERDDKPEPVVFGVDTGAGLGGDFSAIAVVGKVTKRLHATWTSNQTPIPDFLEVIKAAAAKWKPVDIAVESNGIGIGVFTTLSQMTTLPVIEQKSGAEKHQRLTRLKLAIESGAMPVGPEVVEEMVSSHIEKPKGPRGAPVYEGRDDLLNAISFALVAIEGTSERKAATTAAPSVREVFVPARARAKVVRW